MASYHSVRPLPSSSYHSPSPDFVPDSWHGMSARLSTFRSLLFHPVTLISAGMSRQYRIIKNCKPINISELGKVILENLLEHLPPFNRSQVFKVMGWKTFAWRTNVYKNGPFLHFKTLSIYHSHSHQQCIHVKVDVFASVHSQTLNNLKICEYFPQFEFEFVWNKHDPSLC